jgi:hypothetical protein
MLHFKSSDKLHLCMTSSQSSPSKADKSEQHHAGVPEVAVEWELAFIVD